MVLQFEASAEHYTRALKLHQQIHGPDSELVGAGAHLVGGTANNIGNCFYEAGQFEAALPYCRKALAIRLKEYVNSAASMRKGV